MVAELWEDADKYGCELAAPVTLFLESLLTQNNYAVLGQTTWVAANERQTNNQVMVLCYFRSVEDLHAYAHGPLHRRAWTWWNSITKSHPHLSIMHEVYHAPKKQWENIFVNNHLTGIGKSIQDPYYLAPYAGISRPELISTTQPTCKPGSTWKANESGLW